MADFSSSTVILSSINWISMVSFTIGFSVKVVIITKATT